jgi:hypothetical protein
MKLCPNCQAECEDEEIDCRRCGVHLSAGLRLSLSQSSLRPLPPANRCLSELFLSTLRLYSPDRCGLASRGFPAARTFRKRRWRSLRHFLIPFQRKNLFEAFPLLHLDFVQVTKIGIFQNAVSEECFFGWRERTIMEFGFQ